MMLACQKSTKFSFITTRLITCLSIFRYNLYVVYGMGTLQDLVCIWFSEKCKPAYRNDYNDVKYSIWRQKNTVCFLSFFLFRFVLLLLYLFICCFFWHLIHPFHWKCLNKRVGWYLTLRERSSFSLGSPCSSIWLNYLCVQLFRMSF